MACKNLMITVPIALLLLCPAAFGSEAGDPADRLSRAREAAAADRHEEAVVHYLAAVEADTSLAGELGKEIGFQYTWSDKPDSAVIWFERYLDRHPDDLDGRLGLARALSWADRKSESLGLYRRILKKHPESVDARVGEARVVSWQDRNSEAEALYRRILDSHPENLEASLGLAQVVNWQGRHREARRLYRQILDAHPGNEEAVVGLALAERWLGLDWKARKTLAEAGDNEEARKILEEIERDASSRIRVGYSVSSDSDDLVIQRAEATGFHGIAEGTMLDAGVSRLRMEQNGFPSVERDGFKVSLHKRFDEAWSLNLNLSQLQHSVERNDPDYTGGDGFDLFSWDGWVTWTPARRIRIDLSSSRMAVETPLSTAREIVYREFGAGVDLLLTQGLKAVAGYDFRSYSDGNRRDLVKTALRCRLLSSPFELEAVPQYNYFAYDEWKPNGYYNPEEYHNLGLMLALGLKAADLVYFRIEGRGSREKEDGGEFFTVGTFRFALEWKVHSNLDLGGEFFTSNSRVAGEAGYSRTLGGLYLAWIF